jgi:hypothetical protein
MNSRLAENFVRISLLHIEIKTVKVECLCGMKIEISTRQSILLKNLKATPRITETGSYQR